MSLFHFTAIATMFKCRALILHVAAGALPEALAALREAHLPDTAAMLNLICREIQANFSQAWILMKRHLQSKISCQTYLG